MGKRDVLVKILAVAGTVLTALPLLLPLIFGLMNVLSGGRFLVDFLMPAELFLVVLAGGVLLVGAALRARRRTTWMTWSLSVAVCSLALSTGAAVQAYAPTSKTEISTKTREKASRRFILCIPPLLL